MAPRCPPITGGGGPRDVGLLSFSQAKLWAGQEIAVSLLLYTSKQLQAAVLASSVVRAIMTLQLSFRTEVSNLLRYADLPTYLLTFLPEVLMLGFKFDASLLVFSFSHAGVCSFFYYMANVHSITVSICRAFAIHAVCLLVYRAIERNANHMHASGVRSDNSSKADVQLQGEAQQPQQGDRQQLLHQHRQQQQVEKPGKAQQQQQSLQQGDKQHRLHQHRQRQDEKPGTAQQQQQPQQGGKQHLLHQHRQQQQDEKPGTAQQQQLQQEETGRGVDEQNLDVLAAGVSHLQMNKPQGPVRTHSVLGPAPVQPYEPTTPLNFQSCTRGDKSQLQHQSVNNEVLLAQPNQQLHKRQVDVAWAGSNIGTGSSIGSSTISSAPVSSGSLSSGSISSRSSLSILKPTHPRLHSVALAKPLASRAVVDALRVGKEMPNRAPYVSKLSQPGSSRPDATMQDYVQAACRLAVKVRGPSLPSSLPDGALAKLGDRLQKYQCLMPAESPAMRAGCLVISYGALPNSQGSTLQEIKQETVAEAKEWAQEYGLLPPEEEGLLTVQACHQSSWVSNGALHRLHCLPEHSIHVREPFIEVNPASLEQEAFCALDVSLTAPPHLELRAWRSAEDAPEELPDDAKCRSLSLLASIDGQCVATSVEQQHTTSNGERVVQVRTSSKNEDPFDAASPHPKVLVLELWAAGALVCSYAAILLPCLYSGALEELRCWADGGAASSVFVRDLVMFMHFQANHISAVQGREHGVSTVWGHEGATDQADSEVRQIMLGIGTDLLAHCLGNGLSTLAGMLLDALAFHPCFHPSSDLLDTETLAEEPGMSQLQGSAFPSSGPALVQQPQPLYSSNPPDLRHNPPSTCPQPGKPAADSASSGPTPPALSSSTPALAPSAATTTSEEAYQAWKNLQIAPLASQWSKVQVMFIVVVAFRSWYEKGASLEGTPALLSEETLITTLMLPAYFIGALFLVRKAGSYTEPILAAILAARAAFCVLLGLRMAPVPGMLQPILRWRVEVLIEIMTMSVVEQVRLAWMLPLRLMLTVGFGLWYERAGLWAPWLQALLLNACSLAVAKAIDTRYRRMYAHTLLDEKQSKADGGDLQREVPTDSHEQVLPPNAGSSTALAKSKLV
ncbi:hypothetical protein DUNSADRAFT_7474 [Dunaliella salina]|uniref:Uncharacterized protein n=1 Tax=Dunaliella salina TaxID=3046 RepID=A0ABQ7GLA4_DUNSA|nr:hypothetical protein DUNSADRAFT_7474 [Dunaliella salina]|eukprot:KAF5835390.1 hypothetical protein DUNSADRAFT_7474 [Dunaliella salina]